METTFQARAQSPQRKAARQKKYSTLCAPFESFAPLLETIIGPVNLMSLQLISHADG
jgi:hypothetical protein